MFLAFPSVGPQLGLTELSYLQDQVGRVSFIDYLDKHEELTDKLKNEGFDISDRKARESLTLVKAGAVLAGRDHVILEDARILAHVYWNNPEEVSKLKSMIWEFINPHDKYALEQYDAATEIYQKYISGKTEILLNESFNGIKTIADDLKKRIAEIGEGKAEKLQEAYEKVQVYREDLVQYLMGRK